MKKGDPTQTELADSAEPTSPIATPAGDEPTSRRDKKLEKVHKRKRAARDRALERAQPPTQSSEARWTTAALFGAHVSCVRHKAGISTEQLSSPLKRSARWIIAAERGEILFTSKTVGALKWALGDASNNYDPTSEDGDLSKVYQELIEDPFGEKAANLRKRLDPKPSDVHPTSFDPSSDELLPVLGSVGPLDRLLTVWPPILLVVLAVTLLATTAGTLKADMFEAFEFGDAIAGVAAFGAAILLVPLLGTCIRWLVGSLRIGHINHLRSTLEDLRESHDLPISRNHDWYQPRAADFLHPVDRKDANNAALEAELAERMKLALGFASVTAIVLSVIILFEGRDVSASVLVYAVVTTVLWASAAHSARRSAETVVAATFIGLGGTQEPQANPSAPVTTVT